jgi:hypothetical protein
MDDRDDDDRVAGWLRLLSPSSCAGKSTLPPANLQHTAVGTPEGAMQPVWAPSPEIVASLQASGDWNKFMLGKRFQPLAYGGLRS